MAQSDPTIAYSKQLCAASRTLREDAKITVGEAKAALVRSRGLQARITRRRGPANHKSIPPVSGKVG